MDLALDAIALDFEPGRLLALNVILAILMFGVALDLRVDDFRAVLRAPKGPLVGIAGQLLLLPPATFVLVQIIDPIPSVKLGMMLVAACPGGNVSNFLVWMARGNTALSVSMTAVTSSAAVITTPFNLAFWASMDPDTRALLSDVAVDAGDMFTTIFMLLALPLAAGMLFRARYPEFSARIQRPLRMTDGAIFLSFIVVAFYNNREYLTLAILPVLAIVVVHNAMALGVGYSLARLLRLPTRDRRAITLEVGVQNSGLGLALIFNFFASLGGTAIVAAWWGSWHLVGGFALALIWSRVRLDPDVALQRHEVRE
ncbi:MAG: bile acid:sodium symporter family protein [Halioglobus sp.]|nr:bile acid:sodium symporter family protein [Halioglobus sp.]